jgi:hypothetical protein
MNMNLTPFGWIRMLQAAFILGMLAVEPSFAAAISSVQLTVAASPEQPNYRWAGKAYDSEDCRQTIDFGRVIESEAPRAMSSLFGNVGVARTVADEEDALGSGLLLKIELKRFQPDNVSTWSMKFDSTIELTASIVSSDGAIWSKSLSDTRSLGFQTDMGCNAFRRSVETGASSHLKNMLDMVLGGLAADAGFRSAVTDIESKLATSTPDIFAGLQPMLATYRIAESEGVVRKKPTAKGGAVRKLGMGSIVQIIGKLPTGWLQVAKEGEAIGWIHEGSVQAMSVQSQPAVAVAAVPAKPGKPAPAPIAVAPAPTFAAAPAAEAFPTKPVAVSFPRGKANPDDIAVIIGNANYKATAKDIPDVVPAYADAEGMKRYAVQALGIKEENVIFIRDAKLIDLVSTFGTADDPKGKLFNWVKPQASNVFVFYSGHGAPSADGASSYLVPVDAQAALINLSGYNLKTLYANLGKLPAKSVTVVLEACFSGASQSGMLVKNASPIYQKAMTEIVPANLTVISAGSGNQIASWEQDKSHGLFTKHYLLGMAGAADKKPYGNGDGKVGTDELTAYLKGTMSYMAQRYYGREQTAQVATGAGR